MKRNNKTRNRRWAEDEPALFAVVLIDEEINFASPLESLAWKKSANNEQRSDSLNGKSNLNTSSPEENEETRIDHYRSMQKKCRKKPKTTDKVFEKNSSFHVKQRTTGFKKIFIYILNPYYSSNC